MTRSTLVPDYIKANFKSKCEGIGYLTTIFQKNKSISLQIDEYCIVVHQAIVVPYYYAASLVYDYSHITAILSEMLDDATSGLLGYSSSYKPIQSCYESVTVWKTTDDIRSFFTGGYHYKVMEKWKKYLVVGESILTSRYSIVHGEMPHDSDSTLRFWDKVKTNGFKEL